MSLWRLGLFLLIVSLLVHACSAEESQENSSQAASSQFLVEDLRIVLNSGHSNAVTFEVPEDTLSLGLTIVGDLENLYWICEWSGGDGFVLVPAGCL